MRMDDERLRLWMQDVKARGLGSAARTALDALGALGPVAAQALYVAQPMLRLISSGLPLDDLAEALEQPGGASRLRQWLDED
jgi:hypothetical protein